MKFFKSQETRDSKMPIKAAITLAAFLSVSVASAHDVECGNRPVPEDIKTKCCGKADHHFVDPGQVTMLPDGSYDVRYDRYVFHVEKGQVEPSDDGCIHLFFTPPSGLIRGGTPSVWCFQIPYSL